MKTIIVSGKHAAGGLVSQADQTVLAAVARFRYLTAAQLGRLCYPDCHDEFRYARRRLARLADAGLLLRLPGLPTPRYGSTPHVFTLGQAGQPLLGLAEELPAGPARSKPKRPTTCSWTTPWRWWTCW